MTAVAVEERAELGLSLFDPLDPLALAEQHGIPVFALDQLGDCDEAIAAIEHFTITRQSVWSAALVPIDPARLILVNTSHGLARQVSSIAHELAHHLLEHSFEAVVLTEDKRCRSFDAATEKEAKFLSGELLISLKAARKAAFNEMSNDDVAAQFGVSSQFAQMQMAGARRFAQNALRRQRQLG